MTASGASPTPEFSRPVDLDRVGDAEVVRDIAATPEECAALARRFGLVAIDRLAAQVRLRRERARTVLRLSGHLVAEVTQTCIVTLAPVHNRIAEDFTVLYGDMPDAAAVDMEPDADDALEPWPAGPLDIGEAVAQELSLALDPYPRAPGAALDPGPDQPGAVSSKVNPFAELAKLRRRLT
jgi:uncharacterized metal-binding protein YceD (DUF177 family)